MNTPSTTADPAPPLDNSREMVEAELRAALGADKVLSDMSSRVFFSTDIFTRGATADLIAAPDTTEGLAKAVGICSRYGYAVIPRGGGFSYTSGYIPVQERTVIFDLRQMDAILEVNAEDMYVTVQCGCTWKQVYDAVTRVKRRTPYFGPNSGLRSTVGGALSQGSFFFGSTQYGTTADTVLAVKVVLADGSIVQTGSAAATGPASPFFRNFGPDLTGLFLHDAGALGFKAEATLKLIVTPEDTRYATFGVTDEQAAMKAMAEIARRGLASECYLWDPAFVENIRSRGTIMEGLKGIGGAALNSGGVAAGLKAAVGMAIAGRSIFDSGMSLLNVVIDEVSAPAADEKMKMVAAIVAPLNPTSIEPTLPRITHGAPFSSDFLPYEQEHSLNRRLPTHALFSYSNGPKAMAAMRAHLAAHKDALEAAGITTACICFAVGGTALAMEPLLFWQDRQLSLIDRMHDAVDVEALDSLPDMPDVRRAVHALRKELVAIFTAHAGVHLQIGKDYPYRETRQPNTYGLLQAIKAAVDPDGLVNPGALGLNQPHFGVSDGTT